jgi:DNA polymerase III delta prime subunit
VKLGRRNSSKKRSAEDDDEFELLLPTPKKNAPLDSQNSSLATTQASTTSSMISPPSKDAKGARKRTSTPVVIDLDLDEHLQDSMADDWVLSVESQSISDTSTSFYHSTPKEAPKKAGLSQFGGSGLKPTSRNVSSLFSSQSGMSNRMDVQSPSIMPIGSESSRPTITKPSPIQLSSYLASSPSVPSRKPINTTKMEPSLPWCDKYAPTSHEQLAIHPQKLTALVELLSSMLQTSRLNQSHQYSHIIPGTRVLILTGPTGTGKSTAIRLLLGKGLINEILPLEHFDIELVEYRTPVEFSNRTFEDVEVDISKHMASSPSIGGWSSHYESKLKPFLLQLQAQKYPSLAISGVDEMFSKIQLNEPANVGSSTPSKPKIKVLLVDDMPYLHDWNQKTEFQRTIKSILNSRDYNPIVFILSHSQASDTSTPWQLFSREILEHSSVKLLEFNAVNARLVQRTLNAILKQENLAIAKEDVASLVETCAGDIRSAVNSLQWMVEQNRFSMPSKRSKSALKPKFPQTEIMKKSTASKATTTGAYTKVKVFSSLSRDIAPSLFHSLGKVLYAKRLKVGDIDDAGKEVLELQTHHPTIPKDSLLYRPPMKASPELIHSTNVEASGSLLMHYLLENYIKFFGSIEDVISASDYLAYADTYSSGPFREYATIREYSDLVAMRGIMFSNANPKEWGFTKLVKPQSLQSQRTIRDNQQLLDLIYDAPHLDYDLRSAPQRPKSAYDQEFEILGRGELPSHHPSFLGRRTIACDVLPYQGLLMREASKNRHLAKYASLVLPAERAFVEQMVRFPPTSYSGTSGIHGGFPGGGKQTSLLGEQGSVTDADDYETEIKDRDRKHIIIGNIMKERRTPLQLGGATGAFSSGAPSRAYSAYTRTSQNQSSSSTFSSTSIPHTILGRAPPEPANPKNSSFLPSPTTFALPTPLPSTSSAIDDIVDDDSWEIRRR